MTPYISAADEVKSMKQDLAKLYEQIDDIEAQVLARDIAKQIEEELTYPGQIRVTVVRESRATETAR